MKRKIVAALLILAVVALFAGCSEGEETTVSGMVVSVDGTVITLREMGSNGGGNRQEGFGGFGGQFDGTLPEGMEGFGGFGGQFDGTLPEGVEGFGGFGGQFGGTPPEGMEGFSGQFDGTLPEGETRPQRGEGDRWGGSAGSGEAQQIDIKDAHISVQIENGKASGTMEDIVPGVMVTITRNAKGKVTNVLITSSGFGGRGNGR